MQKNFSLFFTRGISLKKWDEIGVLEREIKPYQKLAESFDAVYIFTYGGETDREYQKLFPKNVFIVNKPKSIPVFLYSFIFPLIHRNILKNVQIIKTNQMDGSWSAVIAKKLYGAKLVVRCGYEWLQTIEKAGKSVFKRKIATTVERIAYRNADKIIVTSDNIKDFVTARFSIPAEKITIIANFVDTELFKPLPIEKQKNRIIFIGRLEKEKNLKNLLATLKGLDAELVVIGNGSLRPELEAIAQNDQTKVSFLGNVPQRDLPNELNKSRIFILPSLYEGNPKVLLEAMSCSLACIGSNVSGISAIINDGMNGLLSEIDSKSLRANILKLLENPDLCDRLGEQARMKILADNSFSKILQIELNLYDQLLRS